MGCVPTVNEAARLPSKTNDPLKPHNHSHEQKAACSKTYGQINKLRRQLLHMKSQNAPILKIERNLLYRSRTQNDTNRENSVS